MYLMAANPTENVMNPGTLSIYEYWFIVFTPGDRPTAEYQLTVITRLNAPLDPLFHLPDRLQ